MKAHKAIQHFFKKYVTFLDYVLIGMIVLSLLISALFIFLNKTDFHFRTALLFATQINLSSTLNIILLFALGTLFLFYGMYIRKQSPRSSTFIWGLGLFFWCLLTEILITNAVQSTPFPVIDPWLLKIDRLMGISTSALMAWTHQHPHFHNLFSNAYGCLIIELLAIPILLMIFNGNYALSIFFTAEISTLIVGTLIYYFFPTMAPSGIVHSPYFIHAQQDTSMRFFQIHHFLKPTSTDGGLIAFPSFHVIWAILLTNACRAKKIFFYPIACFNFILIISTIFLGWHYLTDVIGGAILAIAGIVFANWVYAKSVREKS